MGYVVTERQEERPLLLVEEADRVANEGDATQGAFGDAQRQTRQRQLLACPDPGHGLALGKSLGVALSILQPHRLALVYGGRHRKRGRERQAREDAFRLLREPTGSQED